jgi:hypothetical protein
MLRRIVSRSNVITRPQSSMTISVPKCVTTAPTSLLLSTRRRSLATTLGNLLRPSSSVSSSSSSSSSNQTNQYDNHNNENQPKDSKPTGTLRRWWWIIGIPVGIAGVLAHEYVAGTFIQLHPTMKFRVIHSVVFLIDCPDRLWDVYCFGVDPKNLQWMMDRCTDPRVMTLIPAQLWPRSSLQPIHTSQYLIQCGGIDAIRRLLTLHLTQQEMEWQKQEEACIVDGVLNSHKLVQMAAAVREETTNSLTAALALAQSILQDGVFLS